MGVGRHHFEFGAALGSKLVEAKEKLAAVLSEQFAELEDILIIEYARSLEAALAEDSLTRRAAEDEAAARRKASEEEKEFEQQHAAAVEARREAAEKEKELKQQRAAEAEVRRKAAEEALELERQRAAKAEKKAKEEREKEAARVRALELDRQKEEEDEEAEEEDETARKAVEEARRANEEDAQRLEEAEATRRAAEEDAKESASREEFMGRLKKNLQEHARRDASMKVEAAVEQPKAEEGVKPAAVATPSAVQADAAQKKKEELPKNGPTTAQPEAPTAADSKVPTAGPLLPETGQSSGAGLQGRLAKEMSESRKKLEERSQGKEERQADGLQARFQKQLAEDWKKLEEGNQGKAEQQENPRTVAGVALATKKPSVAATASAEQETAEREAFEKLAALKTLTADEVALLNSMSASKLAEKLVNDCRPHVEDQEPEGFGRMWIVIGGIGRGGITVRREESKGSAILPAKLVSGARIEELELKCNRLHYRRIRGDGPNFGWINVEYDGRKLVFLDPS